HAAHVLVASADDLDRGRLAVMLADSGYRVSAAASGNTALSLVRELNPDVVMLGASLPDTDFAALTQNAKAAATSAALRAVVVAPTVSERLRETCVAAGADDIVEGQVNAAVLTARLRPLCRLSTMRSELQRRVETARRIGILAPEPILAEEEG